MNGEALGSASIPRTGSPLDVAMLERTIQLAELGRPGARPNPVVGAVLAMPDGTILASGHHVRVGAAHAERTCLDDHPGPVPPEATLYVSLEPCAHEGRQPSCVDLLLARGVRRVVHASCDPNPATSGIGPATLLAAGVQVERAPASLEQRALQQNAGFHSHHLRGRPYVTAKWAMTRGGAFATGDPERRWVSGEASRGFVHYLRAGSGAVLTGIGTVLADDPQLTVRGALADRIASPPLRAVVDRELRMPMQSRLVATARDVPTLVCCAHDASSGAEADLLFAGVQVWRAEPSHGRGADLLSAVLGELARREVHDVLLESGPTLLAAMHDAELVDAAVAFVADFDAIGDQPTLGEDHPLARRVLAAPAEPSGPDARHVTVLQAAWDLPGARCE